MQEDESLVTIYANSEDVQNVMNKIYTHIHVSKEQVAAPKLIEDISTA